MSKQLKLLFSWNVSDDLFLSVSSRSTAGIKLFYSVLNESWLGSKPGELECVSFTKFSCISITHQ